MKILRTVAQITEFAKAAQQAGKVIGLVPTMGALHEGHLTLMRTAKAKCDVVIASVFVNPVQFGPNEDYDAYPRRFEEDCRKLESVGVDAVFHPEPAEMYPEGYGTYVNVESAFTGKLCGGQRPGHFRGVATVVTKLMNLSRAQEAFFGQKDAQQVLVIKRFVKDLNIQVNVHYHIFVLQGFRIVGQALEIQPALFHFGSDLHPVEEIEERPLFFESHRELLERKVGIIVCDFQIVDYRLLMPDLRLSTHEADIVAAFSL